MGQQTKRIDPEDVKVMQLGISLRCPNCDEWNTFGTVFETDYQIGKRCNECGEYIQIAIGTIQL